MAQTTTQTRPPRIRGALTPSLDELRDWLALRDERPRTVPIFREIMADVETPVSAFLKIRNGGSAFMLESIEGGERIARYSFLGAGSLRDITLRHGVAELTSPEGTERIDYADPLRVLAEALAPYRSETLPDLPLPRFLGGAVGYLSYEAVRAFEPRVGEAPGEGRGLPDGRFMIADSLLVFDNLERTIKAVGHVHLDHGPTLERAYEEASARVEALLARLRAPLPPMPRGGAPDATPTADRCRPNTSPERYRAFVERAKEYIGAGDIFQVVLSQRVDVRPPAQPKTI
jgi:anthranilate synthase component 1